MVAQQTEPRVTEVISEHVMRCQHCAAKLAILRSVMGIVEIKCGKCNTMNLRHFLSAEKTPIIR